MSERFPTGDNDDDHLNKYFSTIFRAGINPRYFVPDNFVRVVDLDLALDNESREGACIRVDTLRSGDAIRISHENPDDTSESSFTFEIEESDWHHLTLNSGVPRKSLIGRLSGQDVPEEVAGQPVRLLGSGFGGSTVGPNTLMAGRYAYFAPVGEKYTLQEWHFPKITDIEVLREDENGGRQPVQPNRLGQEIYRDIPAHGERLKKAIMLMNIFGFKNDLMSPAFDYATLSEPPEVRMAGDFIASYSSRGATGNSLLVSHIRTHKVTQIDYYNYNNEDTLKIGQYTVEPDELHDKILVGGGVIGPHPSADTDKICYTTSNRHGLIATDIMISDENARAQLRLAPHPAGQPSAEVTLYDDGSSTIAGDYFSKLVAREDPSVIDRIRAKIRIGNDANGKPLVMVGNEVIDLCDPAELLDEIIDELMPSTSHSTE